MTRHEILHNYLILQKYKVAFNYKKANLKKTLTLIVFTNTFDYSPIQTL